MKWEYKTVKLHTNSFSNSDFELTEVDNFINQFGEVGWEMISTLGINRYEIAGSTYTKEVILFFKRP